MTPSIQKTLREEWNEKFPPPMLLGQNQEKVADWWLSKLSQALTEQHESDLQIFREKIEDLPLRRFAVENDEKAKEIQSDYEVGFNEAKRHLLASLDEEKK